jgi:hypothetical protein
MQHWHWVYHKGEIKCPQRWEYKFEHVALQLVLFSSIFPYKNYFNDMSYFGVIPITFLLKSYTTIYIPWGSMAFKIPIMTSEVIWWVSYSMQELFTLREHQASPPHSVFVLCCVFRYILCADCYQYLWIGTLVENSIL